MEYSEIKSRVEINGHDNIQTKMTRQVLKRLHKIESEEVCIKF